MYEIIEKVSPETMTKEEARGFAGVLDLYRQVLGMSKDAVVRDVCKVGEVNGYQQVAEVLENL